MQQTDTDVALVRGGPFGRTLAIEPGRRGIRVALVDAKPSTAVNPQANAALARTMGPFRRLGLSARIRALGLPKDFPADTADYTRFAGHGLARLRPPSARQARARVQTVGGSWHAADLPHRVSLAFATRMTAFAEHPGHLALERDGPYSPRRLTLRDLAAGDGSRAMVRQAPGFRLQGEGEAATSDAQAIALFQATVGRENPARMLSRGAWTAGFARVADRVQQGHAVLGDDAVRPFTRAGGGSATLLRSRTR